MTRRKRRQRLDSISTIAAQLRESSDVPAPDLTSSILDRVDATRPFLDHRTRGMLWVGRIAIGCGVAALGLAVALTHRWAPEAIEIAGPRPAPLSNVVETVKSEAGERLTELRVAVDTAAQPSAAGGDGDGAGLLALVSAAPAATGPGKPCTFCGPTIPPAVAARLAPAKPGLSGEPAGGDGLITDISAGAGTAWVSARVRLAGLVSGTAPAKPAGEPGEVRGRVVLDELTPLGIGPAVDSALAPK